MHGWIRLGTDELILYIRKRYPSCTLTNEQISHRVWWWLREHDPESRRMHKGQPQPCLWGAEGPAVGPTLLPSEAPEYQFDRSLLPELFRMLDQICQTVRVGD